MSDCNHCGGDRKIRCDDAECMICALDDYCDKATACTYCTCVCPRTSGNSIMAAHSKCPQHGWEPSPRARA